MMNHLDDESDSGFRCRQLLINTIHASSDQVWPALTFHTFIQDSC